MSIFDNAEQRLHRYFKDNWWDIYDGVPVFQDSTLTVTDITLSVALNSRLDTRTKVWNIWQHRDAINEALSKVPVDRALMDTDIPWREVENLFEIFCKIKYAKGAVATKILHKKRPSLIPIYDKVVGAYFRENKLLSSEQWWQQWPQFLISYMQAFQNILLRHIAEIETLQQKMAEQQQAITSVRTLEVLIWIHQSKQGKKGN